MFAVPFSHDEQQEYEKYMALCHKIQSAIAYSRMLPSPEVPGATVYDRLTSPKHLRVGVDLRSVDNAAMVNLLVSKGLITRLEWIQSLVAASEAEVKMWEDKYRDHGIPATFG